MSEVSFLALCVSPNPLYPLCPQIFIPQLQNIISMHPRAGRIPGGMWPSRSPGAWLLGLRGMHILCLSQHEAVLTLEVFTGFLSLQLVSPGTPQDGPAVKPKPKNQNRGQKLCVGADSELLTNQWFCTCGIAGFCHV